MVIINAYQYPSPSLKFSKTGFQRDWKWLKASLFVIFNGFCFNGCFSCFMAPPLAGWKNNDVLSPSLAVWQLYLQIVNNYQLLWELPIWERPLSTVLLLWHLCFMLRRPPPRYNVSAIIRQYFLPTLGASFMKSVVTGLNSVALGVPLGAVLWMYCWGMRANIEILKICCKLNEYTKMAKMLFIKSNVNIELLGSGANRVVGLITTFGPHLSWITFIYRKYVSMLPSIT